MIRWLLFAVAGLGALLALGIAIRAERRADVTPALVALLSSADASARRDAASALASRYPEGTRGVPALVETLRDEEASVREAAARTLRRVAELGMIEAARIVAEDLTEGSGQIVDASRIPELGILDVYGALGQAVGPYDIALGLLSKWEATTRQRAAIGILGGDLGEWNLAACRAALVWGLSDEDLRVRRAAAAALGLLADIPALGEAAPAEVLGAEASLVSSIHPHRGMRAGRAFVAVGALHWSPGGGARASDVLRLNYEFGPAQARAALLRLARSSPEARGDLGQRMVSQRIGESGDAGDLLKGSAWELLTARLESPDGDMRMRALRALASAGRATPAMVRLLSESLQSVVIGGQQAGRGADVPTAWALGRAGGAAQAAAAQLDRIWRSYAREADGERTRPDGSRYFRLSRAADLFSWALWRVEPQRVEARDYLLAALKSRMIPDKREASARRLVLDAIEVHPELMPEILAGPPVPLAPDPNLNDADSFVYAIADLETMIGGIARTGSAGKALASTLAADLDLEVERIEGEARVLGWSVPASSAERLRLRATMDPERLELRDCFVDLIDPRLALSLVHAIEGIGSASPGTRPALNRAEALGNEALNVAIARARRTLALP